MGRSGMPVVGGLMSLLGHSLAVTAETITGIGGGHHSRHGSNNGDDDSHRTHDSNGRVLSGRIQPLINQNIISIDTGRTDTGSSDTACTAADIVAGS